MTFLLQVLTFRRKPVLENNLTSLIVHAHNALEHVRRLRYTNEFQKHAILYLCSWPKQLVKLEVLGELKISEDLLIQKSSSEVAKVECSCLLKLRIFFYIVDVILY